MRILWVKRPRFVAKLGAAHSEVGSRTNAVILPPVLGVAVAIDPRKQVFALGGALELGYAHEVAPVLGHEIAHEIACAFGAAR